MRSEYQTKSISFSTQGTYAIMKTVMSKLHKLRRMEADDTHKPFTTVAVHIAYAFSIKTEKDILMYWICSY